MHATPPAARGALSHPLSRRYDAGRSTLVTTNKPFAEWAEVFPNAGCVVTLVDRLMHKADIVQLEGESYRLKEARERSQRRADARSKRRTKKKASDTSEHEHVD